MASVGAGVEDASLAAEGATSLGREVASWVSLEVVASVSFLLRQATACLGAQVVLSPWAEVLPSVLAWLYP